MAFLTSKEVHDLIEEQKFKEAYLAVCTGSDISPIDFAYLQNVIEGVEKVNHYNIRGVIVKTGVFEEPKRKKSKKN